MDYFTTDVIAGFWIRLFFLQIWNIFIIIVFLLLKLFEYFITKNKFHFLYYFKVYIFTNILGVFLVGLGTYLSLLLYPMMKDQSVTQKLFIQEHFRFELGVILILFISIICINSYLNYIAVKYSQASIFEKIGIIAISTITVSLSMLASIV